MYVIGHAKASACWHRHCMSCSGMHECCIAVQGSVGWHLQRETKSSNSAFLVSGGLHSTATASHGADRSSLEVVSTQSAHQSIMAYQLCGC